jgi:hypothetical protein
MYRHRCLRGRDVGHFPVAKRRIALASLAAAILAGFFTFTVGTIERCDSTISKWLPSMFSRTDCRCDALLLEDRSSYLLTETGSHLCLMSNKPK